MLVSLNNFIKPIQSVKHYIGTERSEPITDTEEMDNDDLFVASRCTSPVASLDDSDSNVDRVVYEVDDSDDSNAAVEKPAESAQAELSAQMTS
jgi:hypothetical protein